MPLTFISAILTAAGESSRMGRPKALLRWHGVPLIEYQIASLIEGGASEVVVVLGHGHEEVARHVSGPGVRSVLNRDYAEGRTTSVKAGLRAVDGKASCILLLAVDQPRPAAIVATVLDAHLRGDALITSPRYRGRGGHPLAFSSKLRAELESISEERQGVREVFLAHLGEVNEVPIDDPMVRLDVNTPEEYEAAKLRYGA